MVLTARAFIDAAIREQKPRSLQNVVRPTSPPNKARPPEWQKNPRQPSEMLDFKASGVGVTGLGPSCFFVDLFIPRQWWTTPHQALVLEPGSPQQEVPPKSGRTLRRIGEPVPTFERRPHFRERQSRPPPSPLCLLSRRASASAPAGSCRAAPAPGPGARRTKKESCI